MTPQEDLGIPQQGSSLWYDLVERAQDPDRVDGWRREIEAIDWLNDAEDITEWYLTEPEDFEDTRVLSFFWGKWMNLDPCGRYHHFLSPNGVKPECEAYWTDLDEAMDDVNFDGCVHVGDGDPTDIFIIRVVSPEDDLWAQLPPLVLEGGYDEDDYDE